MKPKSPDPLEDEAEIVSGRSEDRVYGITMSVGEVIAVHPVTRLDRLRYPRDLTDEEWALIEPLIPPGKPGGGKRRIDLREVVNGLMYVLSTGCRWRAMPQ